MIRPGIGAPHSLQYSRVSFTELNRALPLKNNAFQAFACIQKELSALEERVSSDILSVHLKLLTDVMAGLDEELPTYPLQILEQGTNVLQEIEASLKDSVCTV